MPHAQLNLAANLAPRLKMNPALRQALALLALRVSRVRGVAVRAAENNPFLEVRLPTATDTGTGTGTGSISDTTEFIEGGSVTSTTSGTATLTEHLQGEINQLIKNPDERAVALALLAFVAPTGWLETGAEAEAGRFGVRGADFEALLNRLQECDPAGVFARNLSECLGIQLARQGGLDSAARLVLCHLHYLEEGVEALVKATGLGAEAVAAVLAKLRRLNPKPGAVFSTDDGDIFTPDLMIEAGDDGYKVAVNTAYLPEITVRADSVADDEASQILRRQAIEEARYLNGAMRHRTQMLLSAGAILADIQAEFLGHGEKYIRPLSMAELGTRLNCNKSTVSRLVADKLCQTPRGMLALKDFFATRLNHGNDALAGRAVAAHVQEILATTDTPKRLSDSALTKILADRGFVVARRTIAKYRYAHHAPTHHPYR